MLLELAPVITMNSDAYAPQRTGHTRFAAHLSCPALQRRVIRVGHPGNYGTFKAQRRDQIRRRLAAAERNVAVHLLTGLQRVGRVDIRHSRTTGEFRRC
jgi:hypothetical protein